MYIDETLNKLARGHSADMIQRKYFDHFSPDGKGVGDRAKLIGFDYSVGENIAISGTVLEAHQSLMKSPGHYNNTINPEWTRCGFGFETNKTGRLYTTIVFSTRDLTQKPLSSSELSSLQKELSKYILMTNKQLASENTVLSELITQWLESNKDRTTPLWDYLKASSFMKSSISYTNTAARIPWSASVM